MSFPLRIVVRGKLQRGSRKTIPRSRVTARDDNFFVPYHLINIINPNTEFNVAKHKKLALKEINDIIRRGKLPILVGGTGLYISAITDNLDFPAVGPDKKTRKKLEKLSTSEKIKLLKKLDPAALKFVDVRNPRRLDRVLEVCLAGYKFSELRKKNKPLFDYLQLGVTFQKNILDKRIDARVEKMIKNGLAEETKKIMRTYGKNTAPLQTIGYKEIIDFLKNKPGQKIDLETINLIKIHTHQFAKRQMTWFKRNKKIKWIKNKKEATILIKRFII
ncbi:MAG: tRNA (adenosine(37)-N6)-dimethylallyltransferase MiaA [Patescibacteria group bacterium]|nr:tRNA (adenosine(37)-N6)-dimethylallyltransferase MiaA [Patescibacteria group bacterium]